MGGWGFNWNVLAADRQHGAVPRPLINRLRLSKARLRASAAAINTALADVK